MGRNLLRLRTVLILLAVVVAQGCAAQQQKEEMLRKATITMNHARVLVVTGGLDQPHKTLGEITYSEPFSAQAIDFNHINKKLRHIAIERYQENVDAIIRVKTHTSADGGRFIVSGKAIEIEGPCAFCRHKEIIIVNEPNPAFRAVGAPSFRVGETWITRIDGSDRKIEVLKVGKRRVTMDWLGHKNVYTPDGNLISGYTGQVHGTFAPDLGTFSFPLKPGKVWSQDWMLKTQYGKISGNTRGRALDWEEITVPAGELKALKVKIHYRTALYAIDMTCWYAPDVGALAKCESTDPEFKHQELVSYRSGYSDSR